MVQVHPPHSVFRIKMTIDFLRRHVQLHIRQIRALLPHTYLHLHVHLQQFVLAFKLDRAHALLAFLCGHGLEIHIQFVVE